MQLSTALLCVCRRKVPASADGLAEGNWDEEQQDRYMVAEIVQVLDTLGHQREREQFWMCPVLSHPTACLNASAQPPARAALSSMTACRSW